MCAQQSASAPGRAFEQSDPIAAVISLLRPQAVLSKVISAAGRWSVRYGAQEHPGFCLMLDGTCFLDVDGLAPIKLQKGDFVLLPAIPGFTMSSARGIQPKLIRPTQTHDLRHGTQSGPPTMRQLGGYFRFDRADAQLVVALLPSIIHIQRDEPSGARLRNIVQLIGDETAAQRAGRELVLERLVEVLLVEALRSRPADAATQEKGLLAGLGDPGLARVLREMHANIARRWTVIELAKVAGMSRAAFADRFTRTVGLPPMEYLGEWRMVVAKNLLRRERLPLFKVADLVGYQSASAFSVAFSRHAGCSPSAFARALRA